MKNILVNSYFADSYIDTDNYLEPNQQNIRKDSLLIQDPDYLAVLYIGHINSGVNRDKGWLFADKSEVSNIKIVSYIPDAVPSTINALGINTLFQVVLYAEHTDTITYIKYSKIQDVLANLGGVINFCKLSWIILFTITNYFDISFDLYCYTYLHNKSCKVITNKDRVFSTLNTITTPNATNRSPLKTNTTLVRAPTGSIKSNRSEKMTFKTGCCRYICARITGNMKDYNKMNIMHMKIKKELEVSSFLRMKEDMYLLKNILFNAEEAKVFNKILDFRDVMGIYKEGNEYSDVYTDYLKSSYMKIKPDKNNSYNMLIENIRKLKNKYQNISSVGISLKQNVIKENNYFKNSVQKENNS